MNKDKYVFAQLIEFLDNNKFRHLVDKYDGNRYVKHFTCWNQLTLTVNVGLDYSITAHQPPLRASSMLNVVELSTSP